MTRFLIQLERWAMTRRKAIVALAIPAAGWLAVKVGVPLTDELVALVVSLLLPVSVYAVPNAEVN